MPANQLFTDWAPADVITSVKLNLMKNEVALLDGGNTFTGNQTINGTLTLSSQATANGHAVRADRTITAGDGLSGGGTLAADRTLSVDSTVVRTSGTQTIEGLKTYSNTIIVDTASSTALSIGGTTETRIVRRDNTGMMLIAGGTTWNQGASLRLYGDDHASISGARGSLHSSGTQIASWDSDGFHVTNSSNVVLTEGNQTIGGFKTFAGRITLAGSDIRSSSNTSSLNLFGGDDWNKGAGVWLRGGAHPTEAGIGTLRAEGNNIVQWTDTGISLQRRLHANNDITRNVNNAALAISGGNETNVGANVLLYGGGHASTPNQGQLRYGSSNAAWWNSGGFFSNKLRTTSNSSATDVAYGRANDLGMYFGTNTIHLAAGGATAFSASNTAITSTRENFIFTTGSTAVMRKNDTASSFVLSGGNHFNNGAVVVLRGSTYSGEAATGYLRSNGTNRLTWDATGVAVYGTLRIPVV